MPHPHEQKLQEVVNSLTSDSFRSFVAARIAGTSRSPPSASPPPPPRVSLNRSLRLNVRTSLMLALFDAMELSCRAHHPLNPRRFGLGRGGGSRAPAPA